MPKPSDPLRFAMLGMIPGNGHPYSWSAIVNGYNREVMAKCPYAGIPAYLGAQPFESVRIPGAQVTHLWTDNPAEAEDVSKASLIPNIVKRPEDVIGQVDGVFISTDDGTDHVRRARPFVEAGIPVFIDKPMATTLDELRTFIGWQKSGKKILSSSGMRYSPELDALIQHAPNLGELRWLTLTTSKTWDRYGIHLLEPTFKLLGPGFVSVRLETKPGLEVAHILHRSGVQVTFPAMYDAPGAFGYGLVCGTKSSMPLQFKDTYNAFRRQVVSFVEFVRSGGVAPFPFVDTVEMMCVLIAGIRSREENSRRVEVAEIQAQL